MAAVPYFRGLGSCDGMESWTANQLPPEILTFFWETLCYDEICIAARSAGFLL